MLEIQNVPAILGSPICKHVTDCYRQLHFYSTDKKREHYSQDTACTQQNNRRDLPQLRHTATRKQGKTCHPEGIP